MSTISIEALKGHDPIVDKVFIPASTRLKDRYERVKRELEVRGKRKLHELARERISALLDEVEGLLDKEGLAG